MELYSTPIISINNNRVQKQSIYNYHFIFLRFSSIFMEYIKSKLIIINIQI